MLFGNKTKTKKAGKDKLNIASDRPSSMKYPHYSKCDSVQPFYRHHRRHQLDTNEQKTLTYEDQNNKIKTKT